MKRLIAACATVVTLASAASADERGDAWRQDLAVAKSQWLPKDRSYSPAARAEAERRLDRLAANADSLSDLEITAEMGRIAALSGNAHTRAYLLRNRGYWRRYPIHVWRFDDGFYVVAAQGEGAKLLGRKLTRVAGKPIEQAAAAARPLFAGNDNWARYMATYTLTSPDALIASGVLGGGGEAEFEAGSVKARLQPLPFERRPRPEESWWFLSPVHAASKGWTHVLQDRPLPPYLAQAPHDYIYLRCEGNVAYFAFNRADSTPGGKSLADFGRRVMADIAARPPSKLIVDLRFNTGGDLTQGQPLIEALGASGLGQAPGRLFVVLGPTTFSAGISPAAWLKMKSQARFAGTSPGDEPIYWAEGGNIDLPNSKLRMHYGDKAHWYSKAQVTLPKELVYLHWPIDPLKPDLPARMTFADYRAGRDPFTRAALGRELVCPGT